MILQKKLFILLGDGLALAISFLITLFISFPNDLARQIQTHAEPFLLMYAIWILIMYIFNLYDNQNIRPTVLTAQRIALALLACGVVGISMFYLLPIFSISPKSNLFLNLIIFGLAYTALRRLTSRMVTGQFREKIGILGITPESSELFETLRGANNIGYHALIISNSIDEILSFTPRIEKVIIAQDIDTHSLIKITKHGLQTMTLVKAYEQTYEKIPVSLMDDSVTVEILSKEKNIFYKFFSRLLGIAVSLSILLITLPITLISALLIKLEDGRAVFYKQTRVGRHHKHFLIWKFQSMKANAESNGAVWADTKDSRITRFGNILRKLHIDEIPQMINILKGDIALVGPRPERPEFTQQLETQIPYYFLRHSINPGFTGWAQIKYRYARTVNDSQDKFEYDLYYLKNRNIFLDVGILLKTVQIIFTH